MVDTEEEMGENVPKLNEHELQSRYQVQNHGFVNSNPKGTSFKVDDNSIIESFAAETNFGEPLYNVVTSDAFERYARMSLWPEFKKLERSDLKRKIIDIYRKQKEELKKYFDKFSGRLVVSCDLWSGFGGSGLDRNRYVCIICYWIDEENWGYEKRVIGFEMLDPYEGKNIASRMIQVLDKFNLRQKVASISFEDANLKKNCMKYLANEFNPEVVELFYHDRTYANVIDLCGQEIVDQLAMFIDPIRKLIRWIWVSPGKRKEFRILCRRVGLTPTRFHLDYFSMEWRAILENLRVTYDYRKVLTTLYHSYANQGLLEDRQWDAISSIIKLLEKFDDAADRFSWAYCANSHLVIPDCIKIVHTLMAFASDPQLSSVVGNIRSKWLEHFPEIPTVYCIATILDPRVKLEGLRQLLVYYYETLGVKYNVDEKVAECKQGLCQLQAYYAAGGNCDTWDTKTRSGLEEVEEKQTSSSSGEEEGKFNVIMNVLKRKRVDDDQDRNGELDEYLFFQFDVPEHDDDEYFEILQWWVKRKDLFPELSKVAKEVLCIPLSSTIPNSKWCPGKRVLDEKRSMLQPGMIQVCVCKKDWDLAEEGLLGQEDNEKDTDDDAWSSSLNYTADD